MSNLKPQDWFGQIILLQNTIATLRAEISADSWREYPFAMSLALGGLQSEIDRIVEAMQDAMVGPEDAE